MNAIKLKDGSYLLNDSKYRYQLQNSRSIDTKPGVYELPDGTKLHIDQNGRCFKVDHATQQPIKVSDVGPIARKMAAVKEPAKKTLPDPLRVYTSQEALDFQRKKAADEKLKKYQLLKRDRAEAIAKKPAIRFR